MDVGQIAQTSGSVRYVWAPNVDSVELECDGERHPLVKADYGWWRGSMSLHRSGADYQFWLNGEGPFSDPRSLFQPSGVKGPSRWVDHSAFEWNDEHWQAKPLAAAIIYEAHIGTFTPEGTFDSAIERLDELIDLGVTHLELMPVSEFLGNYGWGYDGVFPYAPHHAYGGPKGLKRLVNECHRRGLAVILDVVYNHFGPSGNVLPRFGPYFTDRYGTPWGQAINFDGPYSDNVRQYFIDNALMWLRDYHFDGLRLDAVHAIYDHSATHFLEELATNVDALKARLGRHLILIAESDLNDPRIVRPWELGGFGIDAQWSDDIHHAVHAVLTGEQAGYYEDFGSLEKLALSFTRPYVYAGERSKFRRRRHGRPPVGLTAHRFVAYLQNHDQLGNRAQGERLCHLTNHDRLKIGAALILLSPYVPMIFQGEEWSASAPFQYFVDFGSEPELAQAVADGRRSEFAAFGWGESVPDPTDRATFERSKLDWAERQRADREEILSWYRDLIRLRSEVSALTSGRLDEVDVAWDVDKWWLRVERGPIIITCSLGAHAAKVPMRKEPSRVLLASKEPREISSDHVLLEPESVVIFGSLDEDDLDHVAMHGFATTTKLASRLSQQ